MNEGSLIKEARFCGNGLLPGNHQHGVFPIPVSMICLRKKKGLRNKFNFNKLKFKTLELSMAKLGKIGLLHEAYLMIFHGALLRQGTVVESDFI